MIKLRDFVKESGLSVDELLDTFYIVDYNMKNDTKEKLRTQESDYFGFTESYISKSTVTATIERVEKFKPEFYKSKQSHATKNNGN